jgi:hypothetical protein
VVRCYDRGLLRTYLRVTHRRQARDDDVRDALSTLDTAGTESRRKGPNKSREGGEYITPGPDWLWCCDGHDKFRNYGIEIYACVDASTSATRVASVLGTCVDVPCHSSRRVDNVFL